MSVAKIMTKKVISVDENTPLYKVMSIMISKGIKEIPVTSKNKYEGMAIYYDLIKQNVSNKEKIAEFVRKVPTLSAKDEIETAITKIQNSGVGAIPIIDEDRVAGIVSDYDLFKLLINNGMFDNLKVEDVIIRRFPILRREDTISRAQELASIHRLDRLPVVDNFDKVVGEVLLSDILNYLFFYRSGSKGGRKNAKNRREAINVTADVKDTNIMEIVNRELPPISLTMNLRRALEIMLFSKIKGTVVTDNDKRPVGILSRVKLLELLGGKNVGEEIAVEITGDCDFDFVLLARSEISKKERLLRNAAGITKLRIHLKRIRTEEGKYQMNVLAIGKKRYNIKTDGNLREMLLREALEKLENIAEHTKLF